jgi:phosphohistidine phosphatase
LLGQSEQPMPIKQLFLLRHAKSSWDDPELADVERPLAPRGRRAAKLVADHIRREEVAPALVLCSPARRTRETLERISPALGEGVSVEIERGLYAASELSLLERLRALDEGVDAVMLIGHNPGVEQLVTGLAGSGELLPAVRRKYPTGALATLEFAGRWRELGPGSARLTSFVTPKQLAARR